MNRREFVFRSAKALALLSPVLSIRRAEANLQAPPRAFFWMNCNGYPSAADFFPTMDGSNLILSPILAGLEPVKHQMISIEGVNIRDSGPIPRGNNHVRSVGKVLTAKDVIDKGNMDGEPGGISIDQFLAQQLNAESLEVFVHNEDRNTMRERPFATGAGQFKTPYRSEGQAWDHVFRDFQIAANSSAEERLAYLNQKKSLLDDMTEELKRFRKELGGIEKLKLDIHEDAIRKAERSVSLAMQEDPSSYQGCQIPNRPVDSLQIPVKAQAHMDLMFAAMLCGRIQIGGMSWGYSGYRWNYNWVPEGPAISNFHEDTCHLNHRDQWIKGSSWDWTELGKFVKRLEDTPEGTGNMLDHTLVYATNHFGEHHSLAKIPVVLFGNARGQLQTGKHIKLQYNTNNDKVLTSVSRLMGVHANGFGDDPECGPLPELFT